MAVGRGGGEQERGDHRLFSYGKPSRRAAETKVLRIRQAMVIGPTPPGTGVIAPATSHGFVERDVADQLARAVGLLDPLLPDVDHRRARLDPVAADQLGPADRGDDDVGAPNGGGQIARARMRDGDRAVRPKQQLRHRLADDVRAADHDGVEPGKSPSSCCSSIRQPSGVQGTKPWRPIARRPAFTGWKPSTSLSGRMRVMITRSSICGGSGSWTRMPSTAGSAFSRSTSVEQLVLRRRAGSRCSKLSMPASTRRLDLRADIGRARRILADQDHREARRPAGARAKARDLARDPLAQRQGGRLCRRSACASSADIILGDDAGEQLLDHLDQDQDHQRREIDSAEIGEQAPDRPIERRGETVERDAKPALRRELVLRTLKATASSG